MNVDLTPEELARLVQLVEAANMADPVNAAIHLKVMRASQNFRGSQSELVDAREMAHKWKGPI